jgi:hypothetical protein
MAMTPKSNKPRGPVRMDPGTGSPVLRDTANPMRANPNQKQGPRTGNTGTPKKQNAMLMEKSDRTSYFKQLADMVSNALTRRGEGHKAHTSPTLEPISANTQVRRGPTRGNK